MLYIPSVESWQRLTKLNSSRDDKALLQRAVPAGVIYGIYIVHVFKLNFPQKCMKNKTKTKHQNPTNMQGILTKFQLSRA